MSQIIYLTLEQVIVIHNDQVERYGGSHGIRDLGLMESAIMHPQATFDGKSLYASFFHQVAALMISLSLNHPFIDANKRTSTVSGIIFLEINGYQLKVSQKQLLDMAMQIRAKTWDVDLLATWLKKHSTRRK